MGRGGDLPSPGGSNTLEGATTAAQQALTLPPNAEGFSESLNTIPALLQVRSPLHLPSVQMPGAPRACC